MCGVRLVCGRVGMVLLLILARLVSGGVVCVVVSLDVDVDVVLCLVVNLVVLVVGVGRYGIGV